MDETKKISFGFSKISKKPSLLLKQEKEKVQFIESVEEKSIKIKEYILYNKYTIVFNFKNFFPVLLKKKFTNHLLFL